MRLSPDAPRRGTTTGSRSCRCEACKAATARYHREQRANRQGMLPDRSMPALEDRDKRTILGKLDHGTKPEGVAQEYGYPSAAALLFSADRWRRELEPQDTRWRRVPGMREAARLQKESPAFAGMFGYSPEVRKHPEGNPGETEEGPQGSTAGVGPTVESDNIEVIAAQKLREILIAWGPCFHPVQPCDCWPDVRGAILNAARAIDPNLGRW